jgi:phenylacetate-CoA ligase
MMAYIDAAVELVRVARKLGKPLRQLESVMACAGTLTDDARAQIVPFLAKRVHNKYGSRECTDMACESADGRFNIFSHHTLLEVVDENGRPVPEGATGKILVTLLGNHSFPIIRYKIGDMGAIKKTRNRDENTWPEFDKLEGRTTDFISDTRGDYISPVFVRHLIGVMHNPGVIERYQLRQNQAKKYTLLLQVEAGIGEEMYRKIVSGLERDFKEVLGQDAELEFQRVTAIEESASGKFQYIRNLYKTT